MSHLPDSYQDLLPVSNRQTRRLLLALLTSRMARLRSLFAAKTELLPIFPRGDPETADRYVGLPVAKAFRMRAALEDGTGEEILFPNLGPDEIEPELADYVQESTLEDPPAVPGASALDAWLNAATSRERETRKIFGRRPAFLLFSKALQSIGWPGAFIVFEPTEPDGPITIFTTGISDRNPAGDTLPFTRDYELYMRTSPENVRFALNLLHHLVTGVIKDGDDHLHAVRTRRHLVLRNLEIPGLEGSRDFLLGLRTADFPKVLPMAGGSHKLIPVTLLAPSEADSSRDETFEDLASRLIEAGVGVLSDPTRPPVRGTGRHRGLLGLFRRNR